MAIPSSGLSFKLADYPALAAVGGVATVSAAAGAGDGVQVDVVLRLHAGQALMARLEEELSDALATSVSIKANARNKGELVIAFANLDHGVSSKKLRV